MYDNVEVPSSGPPEHEVEPSVATEEKASPEKAPNQGTLQNGIPESKISALEQKVSETKMDSETATDAEKKVTVNTPSADTPKVDPVSTQATTTPEPFYKPGQKWIGTQLLTIANKVEKGKSPIWRSMRIDSIARWLAALFLTKEEIESNSK